MDFTKLKLPKDWQVKPIREAYSFTKKPRGLSVKGNGAVPFLPMESIPLGRLHVTEFEERNAASLSSGTYVENGDLVVAKITPSFENGKQAVVNWQRAFGFATTEVIALQEIEGVSNKYFLFHLLLHPAIRSDLAGRMDGTTGRQRLSKEVLGNRFIPLPPLPEQRRIAGVLGLVQRAMEQQERLLALTAELKKALLHQLFTHGLRHEPQKQTELGPIPQSWEVSNLSDVVAAKNGQVDPRQSPYREMLHVGPENIEPETGRLLPLKTNGDLGIKSGNYLFTQDDVLYSKIRPYLRKTAKPEFTGTCSADMYPLRPVDSRLRKGFFFHLLLSEPFSKQAISFQDRTGIPKINRQQLGRIQIPIPSRHEQDKISGSLDAVDAKLSIHRWKHAALGTLFRTLLHELMTARIRVNDLDLKLLQSQE